MNRIYLWIDAICRMYFDAKWQARNAVEQDARRLNGTVTWKD